MAYDRWSRHVNDYHNENNSQDQVVDGNVEAEKRPQPKKRAEPKKKVEPKRATKKVATKEPKKKAKTPGGNPRSTGNYLVVATCCTAPVCPLKIYAFFHVY